MCRNLPCCCGNGAAHCVPNACQTWQTRQPIFCNADEKSTRLGTTLNNISDSGLPGATISLGLICFYSRLDPRLHSCWRTVGQEEEPPPPAVFEHRVVASMQRHWAFLEQMSGGENGMHTMTTAALFLLTVLSDSLIMMLMLEPWKLWNHHPLRSVVCCAFPSSRLSQTVAKISLDNRMAWNICAQMWAFNSYSGNHLPHWILS